MDLAAGKRVKMPARTLAKRRLRELKPIARELGCAEALARIDWILENGNGAERQRAGVEREPRHRRGGGGDRRRRRARLAPARESMAECP